MELFLLFLFWKHAFADLPLQRQLGIVDKSKYFADGHWHYLHHGILTWIVAIPFFGITTSLLIGLVDYVLHWHIDFAKHKIKDNKWYPMELYSTPWWWLTAIDQGLHFTTYFFLYYLFTL